MLSRLMRFKPTAGICILTAPQIAVMAPATVQVRRFGVTDTLMGMAERGMQGNKDKEFLKMLDMMAGSAKWTIRPWKESMESQLGSWSMYIPGVSSSTDVEQLKKFKGMLDNMTDDELDNPEKVNGAARERIAKQSGHPVDEVTQVMHLFKQSQIVAAWLQMKKTNGEQMPGSEKEMQAMQASDGRLRNIAMKIMAPGGAKRRSGRGRR